MNHRTISIIIAILSIISSSANPVKNLIERIAPGKSNNFIIEKVSSQEPFFELDSRGDKIVIRGNDYSSISTGLNWYLKYYAGIHLSWNNMHADLPETLPKVETPERHSTTVPYRYYLNYCTHSYTMAFWDWERWEQEIDWMALHGINLPLALTGTDVVWRNVLRKLKYTDEEINQFIAGPAFQAWWLMNNLEGWGGPNPDSWYTHQEKLQKKIVERMRQLDMHPVLAGYSGMVPHNAREKLGLDVQDPGLWCSYRRPAFLQPTDSRFSEIADIYYKELTRLYGKSDFYSMDPFHEGGNTRGVDLAEAGKSILSAMKKANDKACWVIQAWQSNPREDMIKDLPAGDMLVLDLFSESRPQWGDTLSTWRRNNGFLHHDWAFCMLLNYGGNIGLHGKMKHVVDAYYTASQSRFGATMKGVGLTMEGAENNPVMYELVSELPWRHDRFDKDTWLRGYTAARYGKTNQAITKAWELLSNSIYNCPPQSTQQGTHESIFCARPSIDAYQASSWSAMTPYYNPDDVIEAARLFLSASDSVAGDNYNYDLIDICRQAVAEKGRKVFNVMKAAYTAREAQLFRKAGDRFLELIMMQDTLLGTRPEFKVGSMISRALSLGNNDSEKKLYEWNARTQITTWGNREAADNGGLHDYANKEWNGILRDFYYPRWKTWIDATCDELNGGSPVEIDWFAIEEPWTRQSQLYISEAESDPVETAKRIFDAAIGKYESK